MYGWLTNTGTKFVIIVDMEGRPPATTDSTIAAVTGLKDSDLKPVSKIMLINEIQQKLWLIELIGISSYTVSIYRIAKESFLQSVRERKLYLCLRNRFYIYANH